MKFGRIGRLIFGTIVFFVFSHQVFADNLEKAVQSIKNNEYSEASIHVRNFLQQQPNSISGRLVYAEILMYQKRPVEAQREMDKALELGASDKQVLDLLARAEAKMVSTGKTSNPPMGSDNVSTPTESTDQIDKQTPEALLSEAIAKYAEQKWYPAIIWFEAYLDKKPDDLNALVLLSKSHFMNGNSSKALEVLKPYATKLSQDQAYAPALAFALIENGQFEQAEALLQKQIDTYGNEPHTVMLLSKLYEKQGMLSLAYDTLGVLDAETSPQSQQMKMQLAYSMQRYIDALGLLRSILEKKPHDKNLKLFEVQLLWDLGSLNEALLVAENLSKSGSFQNQAIEKAQIMKIELLHSLNKYPERNQEFRVLTKHWLGDSNKLVAIAQLQTRMNALDLADQTFNMGLSNNPNDVDLALSYVSFLTWHEKLAKAETQLSKIDKKTLQDKGRFFRLSGDLKLAKGDKVSAYQEYERSILFSVDDINTLHTLSNLSLDISKASSFSKMIKDKIAEYPNKVFLLEILAEHLLEQKLNEEAIFYYSQFLTKRIPTIKRAIALNNLAHLYNETENYNLGIEHAKQAIALRDDIPTFYDTLGWGYAKSGKYSQALVHLRKAHEMAKDSESIKYHLAYTLKKLGKHEEAKAYFSGI